MDLAMTERRRSDGENAGPARPRPGGPADPTEVAEPGPPAAPAMPPDHAREAGPTRPTYRMLIMRGLAPTEAANLTAWISGLDVGDVSWTLPEVNRLLFLRELGRRGHWTDDGGDGSGPSS